MMSSTKSILKVDAIRELLLKRIQKGVYPKAELLPTEKKLAEELSASRGTVSKALASLVHMGVIERKPRVGTRVIDPKGKSAQKGKELSAYAFIYPGEHHPAIWDIVSGFHAAAQSTGKQTLLLSVGSSFEKEANLLGHLDDYRVKAVAVYPLTTGVEQRHALEKSILQCKCPLVLVDTSFPDIDIPTAAFDGFDAAYALTQHLMQRGCRTIGFLSNDSLRISIRNRYLGYRKALEEAGRELIPAHVLQVSGLKPNFEHPVDSCIELARKWMSQVGQLPDGVVCATDYLSIGCLRLARELGISVPGDLSISGIGGIVPPGEGETLTSYKLPYNNLGKEVFHQLDLLSQGDGLIDGSSLQIELKGTLVEGGTT